MTAAKAAKDVQPRKKNPAVCPDKRSNGGVLADKAAKGDIKQKAENTDTDAEGCRVYILRCADGTLYTGWTNDLASRVAAHNAGKGAKYTRGRLPARLVYNERVDDRGEALRREYTLKQLTREEKELLIAENSGDHIQGT